MSPTPEDENITDILDKLEQGNFESESASTEEFISLLRKEETFLTGLMAFDSAVSQVRDKDIQQLNTEELIESHDELIHRYGAERAFGTQHFSPKAAMEDIWFNEDVNSNYPDGPINDLVHLGDHDRGGILYERVLDVKQNVPESTEIDVEIDYDQMVQHLEQRTNLLDLPNHVEQVQEDMAEVKASIKNIESNYARRKDVQVNVDTTKIESTLADIYQEVQAEDSEGKLELVREEINQINQELTNISNEVSEGYDISEAEWNGVIDSIDNYENVLERFNAYLGELEDNYENIENDLNALSAELENNVSDPLRELHGKVDEIDSTTKDTNEKVNEIYEKIPDALESDHPTGPILGIGEEYERSSDRIEAQRGDHEDNMSDEEVSEILYD